MNRDEPKTAAELLSDVHATNGPAFDSWPPTGWFVGPDEFGEDGIPFDWSAPPPKFSVEEAYRWVARVVALYLHWDAISYFWSRHNGPSRSALTNAYLLVGDLRRRGLVPLSGLKMFRVPMDDCPVGFEARNLGVVCDWLAKQVDNDRQRAQAALARVECKEAVLAELQRQAETAKNRLSADYQKGTVTLGSDHYQVGEIPAAFVYVVLTSDERISLKDIASKMGELLGGIEISHAEREKEKLPPCIQDIFDVKPKGHRIKAEYLG